MRKILDRLYDGAGVLAALFLVLITLLILAQIIGRWFGVIVPSTEDFAGFFLAAASFMALAYTFRHGGHIRVSLVIQHLSGTTRHWVEIIALVIFTAVAGFAAWYVVLLVIESWEFGELSQGYIPVPIWIPQTPMALGLVLFFIALVDDLVATLRGEIPGYIKHEQDIPQE